MTPLPFLRRAVAAVALSTLAAGAASAAEFGNISINGYGHQSFVRNSANTWLGADKDGSFKDNIFSLVVSAKLDDRTRVWGQITANSGESFNIDWFYVDHSVTDTFSVRAGKVLAPLGFYNEIIDARFLQISTLLPQIYQPDTDIVDEAYGGVGGSWTVPLTRGKLAVDVYGGQIVEHAAVAASQKQKGLVGGRIDWHTPVDGLRLMASIAQKKQLVDGDPADTTKNISILSAGWNVGRWDLKAEYGRIAASMNGLTSTTTASYVQAGYSISDSWVPFARYDVLRAPGYDSSNPATYQNIVALGVTYRLNANVAFRLENHFNSGYGAAVLSDETQAGRGTKTWQTLLASVAFIF